MLVLPQYRDGSTASLLCLALLILVVSKQLQRPEFLFDSNNTWALATPLGNDTYFIFNMRAPVVEAYRAHRMTTEMSRANLCKHGCVAGAWSSGAGRLKWSLTGVAAPQFWEPCIWCPCLASVCVDYNDTPRLSTFWLCRATLLMVRYLIFSTKALAATLLFRKNTFALKAQLRITLPSA